MQGRAPGGQERPGLRQAMVALQHRDFRLFYCAQVIAQFGGQLQATANLWQVYELTHSPVHIGLTGLARAIPTIILSLVGGVVADRIDRLRLIRITQVTAGLVALGFAFLTATGQIQVWHIYAGTFLTASISAFGSPARSAITPNLVPRHHLMNAIAINQTVFQSANVFGPAIAGLTIGGFGLTATYLGNGVTNVISMGLLMLLRVGPIEAVRREAPLKSLLEGLSFVRFQSIILVVLLMDTCETILGSYRTLLPIIAGQFEMDAKGSASCSPRRPSGV